MELRPVEGGVQLRVHVHPRASKQSVGGTHNGALQIRVTAAPTDGAANEAVCAALALALGVRRSAVQLLSGAKSRRKLLLAEGDATSLSVQLRRLAGMEQPV